MSKRTGAVSVDTPGTSLWVRMDSNTPQPAQLLQLDYSPRVGGAGCEGSEERVGRGGNKVLRGGNRTAAARLLAAGGWGRALVVWVGAACG